MEKTDILTSKTGDSMAVYFSTPDFCEPRFIIQIIHGMNERKERYFPLIDFIEAHGGAAVIHDLPGHGTETRFPGYMGDFGYSYKNLFGDINEVFRMTGCRAPRFLYGHSMGSLIAGLYAASEFASLDVPAPGGVILTGLPKHEPFVSAGLFWLGIKEAVHGEDYYSRSVDRIADRKFSKHFTPEPESDGKYLWLSNDMGNRIAFENDPVCHHEDTLNFYINLLKLVRDFYRPANWDARGDTPYLLTAGELDPVAGGEEGILYAEKYLHDMGIKNVKTLMYRGMRHEIYNDICREAVYADLMSFIDENIPAAEEREKKVYTNLFSNDAGGGENNEGS